MIPSVVARQVRETLLDYLATTFALADPELERALFDFLDGEEGLFKGPYVDVRLPFRKADPDERLPLDVRPGFEPYKHQLKAFQRLYSKDGHQPQHTLVTTGTGSGKTECFLFPVLDHCWRHRDAPGVKAILLYPMNALASDQARRLAQTLWDDERLRGQVTAGLYVGGKGQHGAGTREHLVDQRDVLRDSPPDILLTNYKMLDFLLLRPEDRRLWRHNGPETLRYLVLDELHTYDGAQGSDVACLTRRLKGRLGAAPGAVCCVGTSATLGSETRARTLRALTEFATKVFAEDLFEDSVISEDRQGVEEALGGLADLDRVPRPDQTAELEPERYPDAGAWLRRQAELWLGDDAGGLDPVAVGHRLERHDFLRQLLKILGGAPKAWPVLDAALLLRVPEWETFAAGERRALLDSFLGLVSHARRPAPSEEKPDRVEPFLTVQVQVWVRELRRLVRQVRPPEEPPAFAWADERGRGRGDRDGHWLPLAHCRECGAAGLASFQRESEATLQSELPAIGRRWLKRDRHCCYVSFGAAADGRFQEFLCPKCLRIDLSPECKCGAGQTTATFPRRGTHGAVPVRIDGETSGEKPPLFLARCPDCGSDRSLRILGSRAPSLLSVAISHLFLSDYNQDKKLLAFTDSVQDASHRAGFFGARTYRFNLRTAIQQVLEQSEEAVPLSEVGERLLALWSRSIERPRLFATLWPADLHQHPAYQKFLRRGGAGPHRRLETALRRRLSWEAVMEYGLQSRVGRTLESTGCSTAAVDPGALARAAELLALEIAEEGFLETASDRPPAAADIEHFLRGALRRLRIRGGIHHPLLDGYVRSAGNWFLLTKRKQPLLSPFGRDSVLPRFFTDRGAEGARDPVFDALVSKPRSATWFRDWAARSLGLEASDLGVNELYRRAMARLETEGLLVACPTKRSATAWGLDPSHLLLTREVAQVECAACRRGVAVPRTEADLWHGRPCPQYRCPGALGPTADAEPSFYGRIYRSGRLERIFPAEHTGLLGREERERLEESFKAGDAPGAPNLLVSTPTLEMGIDIGELSAAVLCSVPPTTANYLQRVGRAGRETGNAFCFTVANSRPHDLYFHAEPLEMLAGQVLPPGCFLDAPEMLKRQLVAHAMDAWARQETTLRSLPPRAGFILAQGRGAAFPGRFVAYHKAHREELFTSFLERFGRYLSDANQDRLRRFALGDAVALLVEGAFEALRLERESLRSLLRKARERIQEIERTPEDFEDPEYDRRDAEQAHKLVARLVEELGNKYPLNVLTDAGVLPNYAFPEPGVRLESVIREDRDDGRPRYQAYEFLRPASVAIRELAPFNTFYADGRKVRIDEIDVGSKTRPLTETWRLCPSCAHMERRLDDRVATSCPRCGDSGWADTGQARTLVRFQRSRSLATRLEASTADDQDDREEAFYQTEDLIDVEPANLHGAKLIPEIPFGFELLRDLTLREINFGPFDGAPYGSLKVADRPVGGAGFRVCRDCGRVQRGGREIAHAAYCRARKPGNEERAVPLFLYREIESEALRILLPVSQIGLDTKRASFKAALELGFRRRFQGNPGHLQIKSTSEPAAGGRRQYLVIFDAVPGGTGYLAELWHGDNFLAVLAEALRALETCQCQKDPDRDGCYRCLYAYQLQRDLELISNREAQEILRGILARRGEVEAVSTLSEVSIDSLIESELEQRFLQALQGVAAKRDDGRWEERVQGGELRWILGLGERSWEIRAQVDLGAGDGVALGCRPDFLVRPLDGELRMKAVAVFCDGFAFHALPGSDRGRIGDDLLKRSSVLDSGRFCVWSITWKDLDEIEKRSNSAAAAVLFADLEGATLAQVARGNGLELRRALGHGNGMETLIAYLERPEEEQWRRLAETYAFAWLHAGPFVDSHQAADRLETALFTTEGHRGIGPFAVSKELPSMTVLSRFESQGGLDLLARAPVSGLADGKLDEMRLVLRLEDGSEARAEQGLEVSWRRLLQGWNVLQFHHRVAVTSSEALIEAYPLYAEEPHVSEVAEPTATYDAEGVAELREILELCTAEAAPLVSAAWRSGVSLPELDWQLATRSGRSGPEADLAWPERKVAVLAASQAPDRGAFEKAGWKVLLHPVDPSQLLRVMGEEPLVASPGGSGGKNRRENRQ